VAGQCVFSSDVKDETSSGACGCTVPGQTDSSSREQILLALAAASVLAFRKRRASA